MAKNNKRVEQQEESDRMGMPARIAMGGAVTAAALISGFLVSRRGRKLVADTFKGRKPSPLADDVIDRWWEDTLLGRRRIDAAEEAGGIIEVSGSVASDRERSRALRIAASVKGVTEVRDHLVIDPSITRRRVRRLKESIPPGG